MKPTKTRKKIIEAIEPYMDKSLEFWCILFQENTQAYSYIWDEGRIFWFNDCAEFCDDIFNANDYTILWHYDITALLKYLRSHFGIIVLDWLGDKVFDLYITTSNSIQHTNYSIPNKPLHLYTEKEEVQVLEIINYINNNK